VKLEHIGIAVKDIEASRKIFDALLGASAYKMETVAGEQVTTAFYQTGQPKIELLQAEGSESAIAKYIEKRGEGIHHLAFDVENIYTEIERLKAEGFVLISDQPKPGADGKIICFLHPKSTNGVLVELCQDVDKSI
jgi:methylmalonyl-CoA/ethylmalonyl-CoA epimerase